MLFKRIILSVTILFAYYFFSYSQTIPFSNFTGKQGLPSNTTFDIAQDKKGYLWFASQGGLVMFDGYHFRTYNIEDGLPDIQINTILVDSKGKIWCGTETGGLFYILNEKVYLFGENDSLLNEEIVKIFEDNQNRIWCITFSKVLYIKDNETHSIDNPTTKISDQVLCHFVDRKGNIWFGNVDGLYKFDTILSSVPIKWFYKNEIRDIIEDKWDRLWFASESSGVMCLDGNKSVIFNTSNGLSTNTTVSLLELKNGDILVGTSNSGIDVITSGKVNKKKKIKALNCYITGLYQDKFDRIWAQTKENGIFLIDSSNYVQYTTENGLADNMVTCLFEDANNNIWVSTLNGGISKYGKVVFSIYKDKLAGSDQYILAVESIGNDILVGSYSGLTWFKDGSFYKTFSNSNGLPNPPTVASIRSIDGKLFWLGTNSGLTQIKNKIARHFPDSVWYSNYYDYWASSMVNKGDTVFSATGKGLTIFDGKKYTLLTDADGLSNTFLNCVDLDKKGNIWCGTYGGLSIWDGKKFHNFSVSDGLSNDVINDISIDKNDVAWIATDNGISAVVLEDDFHISTKNLYPSDGLSSGLIYSVLSDNENNIWIGHNKGLDCYNTHTKEFKNYGVLEGFLPLETNMGAIAIDQHKNIWIGTVDGLVKYTPGNDYINTQPPIIYINRVSLFNDTTSILNYALGIDTVSLLPANLHLPYSKNNLVFDFVGLQYTIVEKNRYKFRLLGYEEEWSEPSPEIQTPPYRKLPPGKYIFQVKAANCDGVWTEKPAEFAFQILPPWWKTWWAKIVEISLAIFSLFLFVYLRERKLRNDKKILTQKVKERTQEIENQKDQLALQRDEISRQKEEITDSIVYARRIQSAILPKDETIQPLLKDYFILYKPRDIVSGDFYWIYGRDNRTIVIVADCTGHGVPGAFMSMLGVSTLNEIASKNFMSSSGHILDILRDHLISTLSHTSKGDEARDGMDISLCIIDFNTLKAEYSGAFNPLIILRNGEAEIIKADKMPVGMHSGDIKPFTSTELQLKKNDCLYMFSDGYADQFGGPDCKKFKTANMRALLCEISGLSMSDQKKALNDTIEAWQGCYEQIDDILVMGIRI